MYRLHLSKKGIKIHRKIIKGLFFLEERADKTEKFGYVDYYHTHPGKLLEDIKNAGGRRHIEKIQVNYV